MQLAQTLDIAFIGMPGLFIGIVIGYIVGGRSSFRLIDRVGLGIMISGIGGLILSLLLSAYFTINSTETIFIIIAFMGGYILGLLLNWTPPKTTKRKNHIIYEPDDDDAFDREIRQALGDED